MTYLDTPTESPTDAPEAWERALAAAHADIARLRAALRPFAALLQPHHDQLRDEQECFAINHATVTIGQLRAAAKEIA